MKPITFMPLITKVSTTVDGGFRVTLDLLSTDAEQAKQLMSLINEVVNVAIVPNQSGAV